MVRLGRRCLAGVATRAAAGLDLQVMAAPGLRPDPLPGARLPIALGRSLVGLHLRHGVCSIPAVPAPRWPPVARCPWRRSHRRSCLRPSGAWLDGSTAAVAVLRHRVLLLGPLLQRRHDDVHVAAFEQRLAARPSRARRGAPPRASSRSRPRLAWLISRPRNWTVTLTRSPVVQELSGSSQLRPEIVDVDLDPQPDLLEGLRLLLLLGLALPLLELVLVLPVVEDAAHRRDGRWRHLDEVEPLLLRQRQRLGWSASRRAAGPHRR